MKISSRTIDDFIKDKTIISFFIDKIEDVLKLYEPGSLEHKPEVIKQITELKEKRNAVVNQQIIQNIQKLNVSNQHIQKIFGEQNQLIQILMRDNIEMKRRMCILEELFKKSV